MIIQWCFTSMLLFNGMVVPMNVPVQTDKDLDECVGEMQLKKATSQRVIKLYCSDYQGNIWEYEITGVHTI